MIELIMKRLGVQKSVIITRDLVVSAVYSAVWTVLLSFFVWGAFFVDDISIGVLLIFAFLN